MESRSERKRYITNPLRLLRALGEFAFRPQTDLPYLPYNEVNYPPCGPAEASVATEEELAN